MIIMTNIIFDNYKIAILLILIYIDALRMSDTLFTTLFTLALWYINNNIKYYTFITIIE